MAKEVGADDAVGALVDENLCRSGRFTNAVVGEPRARVSEAQVNVEAALFDLVLGHAESDDVHCSFTDAGADRSVDQRTKLAERTR